MINKGANVNKYVTKEKENYKAPPLYLAVLFDNNDLIDVLLKTERINVDSPMQPVYGSGDIESPLFLAIYNNNTKAIESLLKAGANPNFKATYKSKRDEGLDCTYSDWTPLLLVENSSDKANIVDLLINNGADCSLSGRIDNSDNSHIENMTPLFKSILDNDYVYFKKIYDRIPDISKERLIIRDDSGKVEYTPLQWAATTEKISEEIIDTLLDSNSFKEKFIDGYENKKTSGDLLLERSDLSDRLIKRIEEIDTEVKLFEAAESNDYETIHTALINGKNPNVHKDKKTPLEIAFNKAATNNGNDQTINIIKELVKYGAKINEMASNGETLLASIIKRTQDEGLNSNNEKLIILLFECGADPTLTIENGLSLVPFITEKLGSGSDFKVLNCLFSDEIQKTSKVSYKPNVNQIINEGEYKGLNPLCLAIKNDNAGLVDYLIENGANVDVRLRTDSNNSYTPLGYACFNGKETCASVLLSKKASMNELQEWLGAKKVSILMAACSSLSWGFVERILEAAPNSIESMDSLGKTAFMYAAEFNKDSTKATKLLRNLRGRKANINKIIPSGDNSISLAVKNKQDAAIVMWLLENGVEYKKTLTEDELSYLKESESYSLLEDLNKSVK